MDDTHMTPMKTIFQFSRPLIHFVRLRPKFFHNLHLGRPFPNESTPSSNDNQSVKRIHDPRMTIMYYHNLVWIFFDFFSFS